jgi:hypothetical protein
VRLDRRATLATLAALVPLAALVWSGTAAAHVEASPGEVPANTPVEIALTIEHGCGTSPISKVVTRLPAQLVGVTAAGPEGWTATIADGVVTWDGTARPVAKDLSLTLAFTARAEPGTEIGLPTIESCPNGQEVRWIEDVPDSGDESSRPLPRLRVVLGAPAPTTVAVPATAAAPTTTAPRTDGAPATTAVPTTAAATTAATTTAAAVVVATGATTGTTAAGAAGGGDDGGAPVGVFALAGVAIGGLVGAVLAAGRRRRGRGRAAGP